MEKRLRYADLLACGIVTNRVTLQNWIAKRGFPRGQLTGPNSRTWGESEVKRWLDHRPTAPKPSVVKRKPRSQWKGQPGRRKSTEAHA